MLPPQAFSRYDSSPDELFYQSPRLVTHIDDAAIGAVTQLYREQFPTGDAILDLMSSWVSHLPPEIEYHRVVGVGMNEAELRANPRLSKYFVQNLNEQARLDFSDGEFDGCGICVSIQYLTRPVEVLCEVARVLKADAPLVITFSNRCFATKAVAAWQTLDERGHGELVSHYLRETGGWSDIEILDRSPSRHSDPLWAVVAKRAPS